MSNLIDDKNQQDLKEWYVPDRAKDGVQGPFTTSEIINKLRRKSLTADQFVASLNRNSGKWRRIFEIDDFSPAFETVPTQVLTKSDTVESKPKNQSEFFSIIHNNQIYKKAKIHELTDQYILVSLEDESLPFRSGTELTLTLYSLQPQESLTLVGVILPTEESSGKLMQIYILRVNPNVRRRLKRFTDLII